MDKSPTYETETSLEVVCGSLDALDSVFESRSGKKNFFFTISFIYIFLYIFLFYYLVVQISDTFFQRF
jgi:hypothetical protein